MAPAGPSRPLPLPLQDVAMATGDSNTHLLSRPLDECQSQLGPEAEEVEQGLELLYHGTCAYCKHFHKGLQFRFPTDGQTHTRIKCEKCGRFMGGLGRTDTQFSLASVESFPLEAGAVQTEPRQTCTDRPQQPATTEIETYEDARSDQARDTNPIFEDSQDSERDVSRTSSDMALDDGSTVARLKGYAVGGLAAIQIRFHGLLNRSRSLLPFLGLMHTVTGGFLQRPGSTTTEVSVFGWRICLQLHPPAGHGTNGGQERQPTPETLPSLRTANTITETNLAGQPSLMTDAAVPPSHRLEGPEDVVTADEELHRIRTQRLFQIRREKTLRRNALQQLGCTCSSRCICQSDPIGRNATRGRRSFSSSHSPSPRPPLPLSDVPDPNVRTLQLRLFGEQFHRADSNSTSGSGQMNETLSQASTLRGDSERSSLSLPSDTLSSLHRSSSSPTRLPPTIRPEFSRLLRRGSSSPRSSSLATDARAQTTIDTGAQRVTIEPENLEVGAPIDDTQRTTPIQAGVSTVNDELEHTNEGEPDGQVLITDVAPLLDAPEGQSNTTTPTLSNPAGVHENTGQRSESSHANANTIDGAIERLSSPESRAAGRSQSFG